MTDSPFPENAVSTRSTAVKGSLASSLLAGGLGLGLVAALTWSIVGFAPPTGIDTPDPVMSPTESPTEPERPATDPASGPPPTVRWETPPEFGGRGGDYSVPSARPPRFRPGPYR